MMRRSRCLSVLAALMLFTTGCAGIYNQKLDETAQGAQKSLTDAKLVESIQEERTQNAEILIRELAVVEQERTAARNEQILNILNERNLEATRMALIDRIGSRLKELLDGDGASDLAADLSDASLFEREKEQNLFQYAQRRSVDDPKPACVETEVQVAGRAANLWKELQDSCKNLKATNAKIAVAKSSGMIADLARELIVIDDKRRSVSTDVERFTAAFKKAEKDADAAREQGKQTNLVEEAKTLKARLDGIVLPRAEQVVDAGIGDVRLLGALEWADVQKKAVDQILEAAATGVANVPAGLSDAVRIAGTIPTLQADLATFSTPPIVKLVLEAERLRVERNRLKQQLARLDEEMALLRAKRNLLASERQTLDQAKNTLEKADCSKDVATSFKTASDGCKNALATGLVNFTNAWTLYRTPSRKIDWKLVNLEHDRVLDGSEAALQQWNGLLVPALDVLAANFASGVKADSLGRLLGSLELGWIGFGVQ